MKRFTVSDVLYARSNVTYKRRKKGRQIFSKIVPKGKLTGQRTLQINNAHLDKSNFLVHGELTEANKALCFFSERGVI